MGTRGLWRGCGLRVRGWLGGLGFRYACWYLFGRIREGYIGVEAWVLFEWGAVGGVI